MITFTGTSVRTKEDEIASQRNISGFFRAVKPRFLERLHPKRATGKPAERGRFFSGLEKAPGGKRSAPGVSICTADFSQRPIVFGVVAGPAGIGTVKSALSVPFVIEELG